MTCIEAPNEYDGSAPSLFLAGGITGSADWQQEVASALRQIDLVVLNPRRRAFPAGDPSAARTQTEWEFRHLRRATARLFWFPGPTLCPIALYELGGVVDATDPLFVGTAPDYARRLDVEIQTALARPDVHVVDSLDDLIAQVINWTRDDLRNCVAGFQPASDGQAGKPAPQR